MDIMDVASLLRRENRHDAYAESCTLETCPIQSSFYNYRPSLAANAVFLALFSLSLACFILQAALSRRFIGFSAVLISGCIIEVLGYVGRIMSYHNPFFKVSENLRTLLCLLISHSF